MLPPQEPEDENTANGVADENSLDSVNELQPGQKYQIVRIKGLRKIKILNIRKIIILINIIISVLKPLILTI